MSKRPALSLSISLALLVCCGATGGSCNTNTNQDHIGPSGGEIAAVAVGVGAAVTAVVLIEVNHSHHTLKGCVFSNPSGLELRTADQKVYSLAGTTTDLTPGRSVSLHGDRQKHDKSAVGDQVFLVKEVKKNYGPCQVLASNPSTRAPQS